MKNVYLYAAILTLAVSHAGATEPAPASAQAPLKTLARDMTKDCGMKENVGINVNINFRAESFTAAKTEFDKKLKQVEEFAQQQKPKRFELQSMNYNINSQRGYDANNQDGAFQMSGNVTYQVEPSDAAFKIAEFLTQQKFQVNVNANSYKNARCSGISAEYSN